MSSVSDAFSGSGSSDASGVNDQTFSDASLGDALTSGDGSSFTDNASSAGGFQNFNSIANALSGGGTGTNSIGAQAAAMSPPSSPTSAGGGDPAGAASGTQSNTTPGASTNQNQQQQGGGGGQNQANSDYAPPAAVNQLKQLLKAASGGTTGPTGFTGPTVPPSLAQPALPLPALAAGQTGKPSPLGGLLGSSQAAASIPPGAASQPTAEAASMPYAGGQGPVGPGQPGVEGATPNQVTGWGDPSAGGTPNWGIDPKTGVGVPGPAAPAAPPGAKAPPAAGGGGRDITVQPKARMPWPKNEPGEVAPGGPALPTHKPPKEPAAAAPAPAAAAPPAQQPPDAPVSNIPPSRLIQDITGISTGQPSALADLAKAAGMILPMFMGGGGRRGHFRGGRFTHGFGGFGHLHGGQHPAGRGAWPYHHPQMGWHMHGRPPGFGWRPLHPNDAQALVGGGMGGGQGQPGDPNNPADPNAPDPNAPPKETGRDALPPDQTPTSGAIPGVGAKDVDAYTRQEAQKWGIDPDVASKVLAQESSYGQAWGGDKVDGRPTSFGPFQLHHAADGRALGDTFQRDTGLDPSDPKNWKASIDYAMKMAAIGGWGPWQTTMKKLGMNPKTGITTDRRFAGKLGNEPSPGVQQASAMPVPARLPPASQPSVASN